MRWHGVGRKNRCLAKTWVGGPAEFEGFGRRFWIAQPSPQRKNASSMRQVYANLPCSSTRCRLAGFCRACKPVVLN